MKTAAPYGKTFPLLTQLDNVECWNKTSGERFTLPAGTLLKVEHAYDATQTTCMAQNEHGRALELFPGAYRWIVENQALAVAIGVRMPRRTKDLVGAIIAHESGEATEEQTQWLFKTLKRTGIGARLQGHYSSRMHNA